MNTVAHVEYRLDSKCYFLTMESEHLFTSTVVTADHVWGALDNLHHIEGGRNPGPRLDAKLNRNGVQQLRCYATKPAGVLLVWHGDETSITVNVGSPDVAGLKNSCITALLRAGEDADRVTAYA